MVRRCGLPRKADPDETARRRRCRGYAAPARPARLRLATHRQESSRSRRRWPPGIPAPRTGSPGSGWRGLADQAGDLLFRSFAGIDALLDKVNKEWDKYGCLVSHLPKELFERHQKIHNQALKDAKAAGWGGEHETDDEK